MYYSLVSLLLIVGRNKSFARLPYLSYKLNFWYDHNWKKFEEENIIIIAVLESNLVSYIPSGRMQIIIFKLFIPKNLEYSSPTKDKRLILLRIILRSYRENEQRIIKEFHFQ